MPTDSLVIIDISTIRKANEKLTELSYLKSTIRNKDYIISDYKQLSEKQDSLIYSYKIKTVTLENQLSSANSINEALNKSINNKNKTIAVLGGISGASILITILSLLIR